MTNDEKAVEIRSKLGIYADAYYGAMAMAEWKDEQHKQEKQQWIDKEHKDKIDVLEGQIAALDAHLKKAQEALVAMWNKNQLLNQQPITEQGGWHTEPPTFDCFALLMTPAFPKNCHFVVAEWDNDAECFYSESFDFPIEKWDCWKLIQKNWILENPKYSEEVERIKERNGL
jgi:hypothetical protein